MPRNGMENLTIGYKDLVDRYYFLSYEIFIKNKQNKNN